MTPVDTRLLYHVQERPELYDTFHKDIKNYTMRATLYQTTTNLLANEFQEANLDPGIKLLVTAYIIVLEIMRTIIILLFNTSVCISGKC